MNINKPDYTVYTRFYRNSRNLLEFDDNLRGGRRRNDNNIGCVPQRQLDERFAPRC